jgi:CRISPR-associated endonuclease/helicase Cas3
MNKYLAKPTLDISVEEHTKNVMDEAQAILESHPFVIKKYNKMAGKDLSIRVISSAKYHDIGKKNIHWQRACQEDHKIFKQTNNPSKMHHLRHAKFRHEIASLLVTGLENLPMPVKAAIGAHHGKLKEDDENRWEVEIPKAKYLYAQFKGLKNNVVHQTPDNEKFEKSIRLRYEYAGPRSFLQLADHRASAKEEGQELPEIKPFNYEFPKEYKNKRGVQLIIDELKDEPFSILRAPTGSGKTDASLLWAKHQIDSGKADRLIIAMPTRFTANAISITAAKILSQVGLYHSSAWFQKVKDFENIKPKEQALIDKEQELARFLETPISVTTIDHLCICLTGTREDHHTMFFNLAHSCLVIDEADFYDEFTQYNILVLLDALRILQVPVLLMSATVPNSALSFYNKAGYKLTKIFEDKSDIKRERCKIVRLDDMLVSDEILGILEQGFNGTPLIIYANTVDRVQKYYQWYCKRSTSFTKDKVIMYHSRFTESDKVAIENRLTRMLGKDAWTSGNQYGVAILTQIGELSVNISTDVMLTDICPIDRLVQRAGRLSRFNNYKGKLYVVKPLKENKNGVLDFYCAPYGHFVNKKWELSNVLINSAELLLEGDYSAEKFVNLVDTIYPEIKKDIPYYILNNMEGLKNLSISNWLILPAEQLGTDDDQTKEWKCRDIDLQYTIYVDVDLFGNDYYFRNKSEFRQFQIRHGVQCYAYEFQRALKNNYIEKVTFYIGEDKIQYLWVVKNQFYNSKMGLQFNKGED